MIEILQFVENKKTVERRIQFKLSNWMPLSIHLVI